MKPSIKRNREIVAKAEAGIPKRELAKSYGLSPKRIRQIIASQKLQMEPILVSRPPFECPVSAVDCQILRDLVSRNTIENTLLELNRIVRNTAQCSGSDKWVRVAKKLQVAIIEARR